MNSLDVLNEIDLLRERFLRERAYFPYMPENGQGKTTFTTAPFYSSQIGIDIIFSLDRPLTLEDIDRNNEIAGFINQNSIIRLCSVLEAYEIVKPYKKNIPEWKYVELTRKMRNRFAHSLGKPDPKKSIDKKIFKMANSLLNLDPPADIDKDDDFPLSVDTVVIPLFDGCRKYAEEVIKNAVR